MEAYSVLKTPAYPTYNGALSQPHYTNRSGYSLAYYEPIFDVDLKIPGLGMARVPFVPIQHVRKNRGRRPFVPRHLTEEDMIQINIRADQRAKDIMKDFHPAQRASYESVSDFRIKKEIEKKLEDIRESCSNARSYYKKAEKYDTTRKTIFNPKSKIQYRENTVKDPFLNAHLDHLKEMTNKMSLDTYNCIANFKLAAAPLKRESKSSFDEKKEDKEGSQVPELPKFPVRSVSRRRSSSEARAEQLKVLEERFAKQETESDCFERTYGRHLSKLRGDVDSLTNRTDDFIGDTRYRSFKVDQFLKKRY